MNSSLFTAESNNTGRPYKVEASRIEQLILNDENYNLNNYEHITEVELLSESNSDTFYESESDYLIKKIGDDVYRFDYSYSPESDNLLLKVNVAMAIVSVFAIFLLIYKGNRTPVFLYSRLHQSPYLIACFYRLSVQNLHRQA